MIAKTFTPEIGAKVFAIMVGGGRARARTQREAYWCGERGECGAYGGWDRMRAGLCAGRGRVPGGGVCRAGACAGPGRVPGGGVPGGGVPGGGVHVGCGAGGAYYGGSRRGE
jgi:hypothetical protein